MKNWKKVFGLVLATVCVGVMAACSEDKTGGKNDAPFADGSTIVSGKPDGSGSGSGGSGGGSGSGSEGDMETVQGTYIIYDLGDCKDATIEGNRQEVKAGETYTLFMPSVPVLSSFEFLGWKNVETNQMVAQSGVFQGNNSMYLEAVWVAYGPSV